MKTREGKKGGEKRGKKKNKKRRKGECVEGYVTGCGGVFTLPLKILRGKTGKCQRS